MLRPRSCASHYTARPDLAIVVGYSLCYVVVAHKHVSGYKCCDVMFNDMVSKTRQTTNGVIGSTKHYKASEITASQAVQGITGSARHHRHCKALQTAIAIVNIHGTAQTNSSASVNAATILQWCAVLVRCDHGKSWCAKLVRGNQLSNQPMPGLVVD